MIRLGVVSGGAWSSPRWCIPRPGNLPATGHAAITRSPILSIRIGFLLCVVVVLVASCGGAQVPPHASTAVVPTSAAAPAASVVPEPTGSSSSQRVIVTLSVPFTPEGNLPSQEAVQHQRQRVVEAQDGLLADLKPFVVRVLARFDGPQLALLVDDDALRHLRSSPRVASIQEDIPQPPSG